MAKKQPITKEVKEFSWDTEVQIGQVETEKERHTFNICTLNGKTYVQDVKEVMTAKNGWKRTKGATITMDVFKQMQDAVGTWEMGEAFGTTSKGSTTNLQAPLPTAVAPKSKGLTAMRGKKLSIREQLERNSNFGSLTEAKQSKLLETVSNILEDYGMCGIIISKTDYRAIDSVSKDATEKTLRAIKGYARGQYTFIAQ